MRSRRILNAALPCLIGAAALAGCAGTGASDVQTLEETEAELERVDAAEPIPEPGGVEIDLNVVGGTTRGGLDAPQAGEGELGDTGFDARTAADQGEALNSEEQIGETVPRPDLSSPGGGVLSDGAPDVNLNDGLSGDALQTDPRVLQGNTVRDADAVADGDGSLGPDLEVGTDVEVGADDPLIEDDGVMGTGPLDDGPLGGDLPGGTDLGADPGTVGDNFGTPDAGPIAGDGVLDDGALSDGGIGSDGGVGGSLGGGGGL